MALTFNGNTPKTILYNGNDVKKVVYNGTVVWQKYKTISFDLLPLFAAKFSLSDWERDWGSNCSSEWDNTYVTIAAASVSYATCLISNLSDSEYSSKISASSSFSNAKVNRLRWLDSSLNVLDYFNTDNKRYYWETSSDGNYYFDARITDDSTDYQLTVSVLGVSQVVTVPKIGSKYTYVAEISNGDPSVTVRGSTGNTIHFEMEVPAL